MYRFPEQDGRCTESAKGTQMNSLLADLFR
jgi:hypothetical protein